MDTLSYKTQTPNAQHCERNWVIIDATDMVLGRLCSQVAKLLRGKNKPCFSPFVECGDYVIIVNADKIQITGNKWTDRVYLSYTGYPGGQRETNAQRLMAKSHTAHYKAGKHPLFMKVMKGMLPKNRLGRKLINNLYVYNGPEHPHEAQNPQPITLKETAKVKK